jgi:hypothetical protein
LGLVCAEANATKPSRLEAKTNVKQRQNDLTCNEFPFASSELQRFVNGARSAAIIASKASALSQIHHKKDEKIVPPKLNELRIEREVLMFALSSGNDKNDGVVLSSFVRLTHCFLQTLAD